MSSFPKSLQSKTDKFAKVLMGKPITIALPKGRILEELMPALVRTGLAPRNYKELHFDRRLMVESMNSNVRLVILRASDVQTYVSYGAAQLGLVGRDMLLENTIDGLVYGLDTGLGKCDLVVAAPKGFDFVKACQRKQHLSVATKYPRLAQKFLAQLGVNCEIVKLYGSMELAPQVGLSDVIVDIVATGETLKANGLVVVSKLIDVSTHLVINQAAFWRRSDALKKITSKLATEFAN